MCYQSFYVACTVWVFSGQLLSWCWLNIPTSDVFLGFGENGIEDIKAHDFFKSIDWEVCCVPSVLLFWV